MNNNLTDNAKRLLNTLAQQDTEKRHAQDTAPNTELPIANNPEIVAWLRSLAPLTDKQLYDTAWKD